MPAVRVPISHFRENSQAVDSMQEDYSIQAPRVQQANFMLAFSFRGIDELRKKAYRNTWDRRLGEGNLNSEEHAQKQEAIFIHAACSFTGYNKKKLKFTLIPLLEI